MFEMLMTDWLGKPMWMWISFLTMVLILLVLDLGVLHRKQHVVSAKESLITTAGYMFLSFLFGSWVWWELGADRGMEYFTGYVVELSLSMDNVFVIAMILSYFHIPRQYQHRVLFWGILGVILLRGVMIGAGAALVHQFHAILYLFGAFLIFTGIKMLMANDEHEGDLSRNPILKFLRRYGRVTDKMHGDKFFAKMKDPNTGRFAWYMTPLMVSLILVELADVLFAVDSVPAIFAITTDPFIVFTSNIFAILGLRSLFFALSAMLARFAYLKYALSILLIFIGGKMFVSDMLGIVKISSGTSLAITLGILVTGVVYSLIKTKKA